MEKPVYLEFDLPEYMETPERPLYLSDLVQENGGNVVAIAGQDFAVIASDTRLSADSQIQSREQQKLFRLSDRAVLGCCGCWCDVLSLTSRLELEIKIYEQTHRKIMDIKAIAHFLSIALYAKRFSPLHYRLDNIVAGLNAKGKGVVYSIDPVGHLEKESFRCGGTASSILQPLLDNQIGRQNIEELPHDPLTPETAISVIKDAFLSATERDVYTGDGIIVYVITRKDVRTEEFPLRKD